MNFWHCLGTGRGPGEVTKTLSVLPTACLVQVFVVKMTSRLSDLRKDSDVRIDIGDGNEGDSLNRNEEKSFLTDFFNEVENVKKYVNSIKKATKRISEIQQQVIFATTNDKEAELSAELKPLTDDTNKEANLAKTKLAELRDITERMKGSPDNQPSEIRIRDNLISTLTRKFIDVMKEYQSVQTKYKTEIKKKVKRQVQIVKADATSEEIDLIIKSGGTDQVFQETILQGDANEPIKNMYKHVADKYQDVLTLEASVNELNHMFVDFALLVEQQGELLDQIEFQVKAAADYIDEGNVKMVEAIEIQKSIIRQRCCIIGTIIIIIAIIVAIIFATTSSGDSSN
jgi:t-SNARE complex subunit (syntaxin)